MPQKRLNVKKLFVLDTNVLMHDASALFRFKEHDIYLPMVVLEELDGGKKGLSETARNVRQLNRFLDTLISKATTNEIQQGIALSKPPLVGDDFPHPTGRIFFQTEKAGMLLPDTLPGNKSDNAILAAALAWQAQHPEVNVVLVSKDINLRIKASILGVCAEDYTTDQVVDDLALMYSGVIQIKEDFWSTYGKNMESWQRHGRTYYKIKNKGLKEKGWNTNFSLTVENDPEFGAIIREVQDNEAVIEMTEDFRKPKHHIWGITARNDEQNFALNYLMDPDIDFVTLVGSAGTGKTLLTLAAALKQTLDMNRYREILVTRVTVPVGEDIGFLPGSEEEKMTPWMGALLDNLEVLSQSKNNQDILHVTPEMLVDLKIRIRSLNFMRGRTFLNKFVIIDEAQNLTAKQMQTLITRAGPDTKIVCLGNIRQIDTPYLTETTSGLTYVVHQFKGWKHSAHITLARGERSRLADHAAEVL